MGTRTHDGRDAGHGDGHGRDDGHGAVPAAGPGQGTRRPAPEGTAPARALDRLRHGTDPPARAARRAVRVTLAACIGFYVFRYALDRPVSATYALFSAVSVAALARIPGTGRQRAAVMVRLVPVGCVLVTIGTFLAVRTWSAVAGTLVIGFCLAFIAAAGPRPAGASPGLQLLYILPCFPPYAPDTLGERLTGTVVGMVLAVLAEAYVLPDPAVPGYRERAAAAVRTAARCAAALRTAPHALSADDVRQALAAGEAVRPSRVPEAERPAGPQVRERALAHTGLAVRTLLARLRALPVPRPAAPPGPGGLALLGAVEDSARETAALLVPPGGPAPAPAPASEDAAARALGAARARTAALQPAAPADRMRHAALLEIADAALVLGRAARIAVRGRGAVPDTDEGRFWYATTSSPRLWWIRLAGHAGPRSVHFQNAVRISLALAVARTVAGLDTLPHGFWAMLAVLSLTRTTAVQTRATVRSALIGTLLGALAAGAVLALAAGATLPCAILLPPLMLAAFCIGPVRGVGWTQALFTLVVATAFAQLAPATWQLAEVRFLDVLIGSVIGITCGLLAWPKGAHDELGRSVARMLRSAAEEVAAVTRAVTGTGTPPPPAVAGKDVQHALLLAETAYAQFQGEAQRPPGPSPDWQSALMAGHHVLWGAHRVLDAAAGPQPDEAAGHRVRAYGAWVAEGFARAAARFDVPRGGRGPAPAAEGAGGWSDDGPQPSDATRDAPPLFFTATAWLDSLTTDLGRMAAAHAVEDRPMPPGGRSG
ncbi:FUSC family protein [Streptomyces sp. NPDC059982]|uniref:FUSC family protein n=1 Tax=Streptomyces sp. NPDC059982 TaxID=3347024 RepID=UPI0036CDD0C6